ncbi:MAG TPA: TonB-dependent receptor [Nevskiaceae bacterium]|nr:TonB-dependent receptor [Nevskiaceae bacterium]
MNGFGKAPSWRTVVLGLLIFVSGSAAAQAPPVPEETPSQAPPPPYEQTVPVPQAAEAAPAEEKKEEVKLEKVEVTGTRLKRTDYETAQPVVTISRADIDRTGLTDISEILRELSVAGNDSLTPQEGRALLSLGETNLDLRGVGAQHTLILVNGRRWVTGLSPTQPSVSDLQTIPTAIIDRIEILKDGASAVYGSDAIGGVVNIITRKDFSGFALSQQVGGYMQYNDGLQQQSSISWGMVRPNTSLFLNFSFTGQDRTETSRRTLTQSPEPGTGFTRWSGVTTNGRYEFIAYPFAQTYYQCPNLQAGIAAGAAGDPLGPTIVRTAPIPAGLSLCDIEHNATSGNSLSDFHRRDPNNLGPDDLYNRYTEGSLTEPNRRSAWYLQFTQRLTDHIQFQFDGFYNRRSSFTVGSNLYLAGGNLFAPGAGRGYIPATNPNNPFGQDIGRDDSCIATGANSATCAQIGPGAGLWLIRQKQGANTWGFTDNTKTWRFGGGLQGDLSLFDRPYTWDAGYIYSTSNILEVSPLYRWDREAQALGTEGTCTDPCVPLDVFHGEAGLTQAMLDWVYYNTYQKNKNRKDIAYFDISGDIGALEQWMAGPIAVAFGLEYRRDGYDSLLDPVVQQGLTILNSGTDTHGSTDVKEAYLELGIPVVKNVIGLEDVDIDIAGRFSKYPDFGAVKTGKAGLRWKPIEDILIRGTYSTGFRAPNVGELFLGPTQSYDALADPCAAGDQSATTQANCADSGLNPGGTGGLAITPYDLWVGNKDLQPEKSHNITYGIVLSPRWIRDLNINADFYSIEIKNFIAVGLGQFYLDSCYKQNPRNYCNYIHRNTIGDLLYVDAPFFNYSSLKTAGVDFGIDYVLPIPSSWDLGRFKIALDASYLKQFDQTLPQPGTGDQTFGSVGQEGTFTGYPRVKGNGTITYKRNWFNASWIANLRYHLYEICDDGFAPSLKDFGLCSDPNHIADDGSNVPLNKLRTVWYHNVQVGFDLPWYGVNITAGVDNVFDRDPPQSYGANELFWFNYDPNHYEIPGRFGYLRMSAKF